MNEDDELPPEPFDPKPPLPTEVNELDYYKLKYLQERQATARLRVQLADAALQRCVFDMQSVDKDLMLYVKEFESKYEVNLSTVQIQDDGKIVRPMPQHAVGGV